MSSIDRFITGQCIDALRSLDSESVQCCVTSPPYWGLRDYGEDGQIGLEKTPEEYVARLVEVFAEVRRVLRDDGVLWLNLGDSYASDTKGSGGAGKSTLGPNRDLQNIDLQKMEPRRLNHGLKPKDLVGIPWRVAFALQADGWYLRSEVIWAKPNPMPESVRDRPTKAHEQVFLLSKSGRYFYDADAVKERANDGARKFNGSPSYKAELGGIFTGKDHSSTDTRNKRSVWTIATQPFAGAHFATMPPELAETCIKAGSKVDDVVLDPFGGAGTTALSARLLGRRFVHIDLNPSYIEIARRRVEGENFQPGLFGGAP